MKISALFIAVVIAVANSTAEARTHFYDEAGRLVKVAYPQGNGIEYQYDAADNLTSVKPLTLPVAPANLSVERTSNTTAQLSWSDVTNSETGYIVMRRLATDKAWQDIATLGRNATSYTDNRLTAGRNYVYRVAANSAQGLSAYSYESAAAGKESEAFTISLFSRVSDKLVSKQFKIDFHTSAGVTYRVQWSDDLINWAPLSFSTTLSGVPTTLAITGNGSEATLFAYVSGSRSSGYFRIVEE